MRKERANADRPWRAAVARSVARVVVAALVVATSAGSALAQRQADGSTFGGGSGTPDYWQGARDQLASAACPAVRTSLDVAMVACVVIALYMGVMGMARSEGWRFKVALFSLIFGGILAVPTAITSMTNTSWLGQKMRPFVQCS